MINSQGGKPGTVRNFKGSIGDLTIDLNTSQIIMVL